MGMKKLFLALAVSHSSLCFSQKLELGLGIGASINTTPSGNLVFKGDKSTIKPAANLQALYNISERFQTGIELSVTGLSGKGKFTYIDSSGQELGTDVRRFIYAKTYASALAVFNVKFGDPYRYAYAGVALGYGVGRHDSKELKPNEAFRTPDGGKGLAAGVQAGVVQSLGRHISVFGSLALRYHQMNYDTPIGTCAITEKLSYTVMSVPVLVGIRIH